MAKLATSAGEAAVQQLADALREEMMVAMLNAMQNTASMLADIASQHLSELRQVMLVELAEQASLQPCSPPRGGAVEYLQSPAVAVAVPEEPQKRPPAQPQPQRAELTLPDSSDAAKDLQRKPPGNELPSDAAVGSIGVIALTSPAPTESTRASNSEVLPQSPESSDVTPSAGEITLGGLPAEEPARPDGASDEAAASSTAAALPSSSFNADDASNEEAASTNSGQRGDAEGSRKGKAAAGGAEERIGEQAALAGAQERDGAVAESGDAATGSSPGTAPENGSSIQTAQPDAAETVLPSVPAADKPGTSGCETSSGSSSATSGGHEGTCSTEAGGSASEEAGPVQRSPTYGSVSEAPAAAKNRRRGWSAMLEKAESGASAAADCPQSRDGGACGEGAHESGEAPRAAVAASPLLARTCSQEYPAPSDSPEPCEPLPSESRTEQHRSSNPSATSPEEGTTMFTMMSDSDDDVRSVNSYEDYISKGWNEFETVDKERQARERLEKRFAAEERAAQRQQGGFFGAEEEEEEEEEEGTRRSSEDEREAARQEAARQQAAAAEAKARAKVSEMARMCMSCRKRSSNGKFGDPPHEHTKWYCESCWDTWELEDKPGAWLR